MRQIDILAHGRRAEKTTRGEIYIENEKVACPDPKCAIVFQKYLLSPWKAIRKNMEFGPKVRGLSIWQQARCTVLFVTHGINEAIYLSDRVVIKADRSVILNKAVKIMDLAKTAGAGRLCLATEKGL